MSPELDLDDRLDVCPEPAPTALPDGPLAQQRVPPTTEIVPVLSGGGTRFPTHVGVLQALARLPVRYGRMIGLSGGSIVAALHAVGYSANELEKLAYQVSFEEIVRLFPPRLLYRGGMCSGRQFEEWMEGRLQGARFQDLDLDLVIIATDIRTRQPALFSRATTPELPVARAVRFSMGIPVLFDYQQYDDMILVDGEILCREILMAESLSTPNPVVVFQVGSQRRAAPPSTGKKFRVADYFIQLADAFVFAMASKRLTPWAWQHTVVIDTGPVPSIKFKLSPTEKQTLIACGYRTTLDILPAKLGAQPRAAGVRRVTPPPELGGGGTDSSDRR